VLLHGPCELAGASHPAPSEANAAQWKGLIEAKRLGLTRAIGVSNYNISHLEALATAGLEKPSVNQCEMSINGSALCFPGGACLHGAAHDDDVIGYCAAHGIQYEAYDTLKGCPFGDAKTEKVAAAHDMSMAQLCLRWALQRGAIIAAGTGNDTAKVAAYSQENLDVFKPAFQLSSEEMLYLDSIRVWRKSEHATVDKVGDDVDSETQSGKCDEDHVYPVMTGPANCDHVVLPSTNQPVPLLKGCKWTYSRNRHGPIPLGFCKMVPTK